MKRVLISDPLPEEGLAVLQREEGIEVDMRPGLESGELRDALSHSDGIIIRSGTNLDLDVLSGQTRLRAIVRAGVGVDNIDVAAATREGIVVMNTPGGNTLSTAEHTIALLFALSRHVPAADASLRAGRWDRKKFVGAQLAGKTLGIVGLGRVGVAVAKRAMGLEMRVIGYDPLLAAEKAAQMGIEAAPKLDDVFAEVDVLSVHVPFSEETRGLIGAPQLKQMRPGSYVINCARGGIVDEIALQEALESGHLAGAAIDVFAKEPTTDSPLFRLPNVVVTPHLGASTSEAQLNVAIEAADLMAGFLLRQNVRFAVNMASVDPTELKDVRRHLDIAHRLGLLQSQLAHGRVKSATVQYQGEAAQKNTRLITAAFAMGFLQHALEEQVNLINANLLAEERGIQFSEQTSSEPSDFHTLIRTEVQTDRDHYLASGTTRGNQYNRLVRLGPYRLDTFLDGTMLVYTHMDKPGLIGFAGTVLGTHGVNIAQMNVGRKTPGGDAIGVLALDSEPPEHALDAIRDHEHISSVQVVKLPPAGELPTCFG